MSLHRRVDRLEQADADLSSDARPAAACVVIYACKDNDGEPIPKWPEPPPIKPAPVLFYLPDNGR